MHYAPHVIMLVNELYILEGLLTPSYKYEYNS